MPRTKAEKNKLVQEIDELFTKADSFFLVSLTGLASNDVNKLRASLRKEGARMRVVKNRLARRAAEGKSASDLDKQFRGPTAIVYHPTDPVGTAKGLVTFAKDQPLLVIKGGLVERKTTVDAAGVKTVSELPGPQEMRAMLLGLLQAPAGKLVRLLNTPQSQLARCVGERERQLGGA